MRLFLAVTPSPQALEALAVVISELRDALNHDPSLRWVDIDHQHLTVHFIGNLDPADLDALVASMSSPLDQAPFQVAFGDLGIFPAAGPPRVIWMGLSEGASDLARLHGELGVRLTRAGVEVEARPFTPHVTLARVRTERRAARSLRRRLAALPVPADITSQIDRVTLFESDLSGRRPRYRVITELPLTASR